MRILLDTNVLVAAFATRGFCFDILQLVLAEHRLLVGETRRRAHSSTRGRRDLT